MGLASLTLDTAFSCEIVFCAATSFVKWVTVDALGLIGGFPAMSQFLARLVQASLEYVPSLPPGADQIVGLEIVEEIIIGFQGISEIDPEDFTIRFER